jgi:hypothetical protein
VHKSSHCQLTLIALHTVTTTTCAGIVNLTGTRRSKRKASSPAAALSDEYDGDAPKRKSARSVKTNTFYTEDSVV